MAFNERNYQKAYKQTHYDNIYLRLPKGKKDQITAAATASGKSLNKYILDCLVSSINTIPAQKTTLPALTADSDLYEERAKTLAEIGANFRAGNFGNMYSIPEDEEESPIDRPHDDLDSMLANSSELFGVNTDSPQIDKPEGKAKSTHMTTAEWFEWQRSHANLINEENEDEQLPF